MLITHTIGGQLQFADQFNDQNLFQATGNYAYANTVRFNNTGFVTPSFDPLLGCPLQAQAAAGCVAKEPLGYMSVSNGVYTCYDGQPGTTTSPNPDFGQPVPCISGAARSNAYLGPGGVAGPNTPAGKAGAIWGTLWNGNASGTYNTVKPQFWNVSASDEFRPNDKWLFNVALRYDDFDYGLANTNTPQNQFYGQELQKYACWNGTNVAVNPLGPGVFPPPNPILTTVCPAGYFHPGAAFSIASPPNYNIYYWSPRYSATYTASPDTVWRFSGGRYVEPPLTAAVQYQNLSGNALSLWANFLGNGFTSPFHALPGETSAQYDVSLERHIRGTDMSFKLSPFYGLTSNWEQQSFIGAGFVTQIPVGRYQNYGLEAALSKGDFNRNGLSGQLSFTYTHAYTQYQSGIVPNQISTLNQLIGAYNKLTKSGGGAACYQGGVAAPCNSPPKPCAFNSTATCTAIANPYYNDAPQGMQDVNGWYPGTIYQLQPSLGPGYAVYAQGYASPYVTGLILNYRKNKLAVTPSFQVLAGTNYGSPEDVAGLDPRVCTTNQGTTKVATTNNPLDCDYRTSQGPGAALPFGYLYIPNPSSGSFSKIGQYQEPNIAVGNLQVSYDLSNKIKLQATMTNIFHTCWGGSTGPWSSLYSPGSVYCGYNSNSGYVGTTPGKGWFNGASPQDTKANGVAAYPWQTSPYIPGTGNGLGGYFPFSAYFSAQIKI
jgi:hypothetical protein